MTSRWRRCEWGDIAVLEYGKAIRDYRDGRGDTEVFGTNGPVGRTAQDPHSAGPGVVVGRKGAYRGIHYARGPFAVIDTAFWIRPSQPLDLRWAYYELLTHDINSMDSGSAIPSTSRDAFYRMPVLVPPLEEQRAIAATLGALDDKIASNRQTVRKMSDLIDALAERLFADSETRGCDLADVVEFNRVTVKPRTTEAVQYIDIASVSPGRIDAIKELSWDQAPSRARRGVADGDVIFSTVRPGRRSYAQVLDPAPDAVASTGFAVMTPTKSLGSSLLTSVVGSEEFASYLESVAHGSAYPAVSVEAMGKYAVRVPRDAADAVRFEGLTMPTRRRAAQAEAEAKQLAALRDALLPELISGRIGLSEEATV